MVKIRLEIILSDFSEKKETFYDLKNRIFESLKKSHFSKKLTHAFNQKMPIFSLFTIDKKRLEIMLGDFAEKKETFSHFKQQSF